MQFRRRSSREAERCDGCFSGPHTLNGGKGSALILSVQVSDLLAKNEGQFDLIMEVDSPGPDDRAGSRQQKRGWGLEEEEWLLRPLVVQLGDMVSRQARGQTRG